MQKQCYNKTFVISVPSKLNGYFVPCCITPNYKKEEFAWNLCQSIFESDAIKLRYGVSIISPSYGNLLNKIFVHFSKVFFFRPWLIHNNFVSHFTTAIELIINGKAGILTLIATTIASNRSYKPLWNWMESLRFTV